MDEVGQRIIRCAGNVQRCHDGAAPARRACQAQRLQGQIGLIAGVPHGHEDAGDKGHDHEDHDPLQIHSIPDMGCRVGGVAAPHEKGVQRVKGWVPGLEASSLVEEGGGFL